MRPYLEPQQPLITPVKATGRGERGEEKSRLMVSVSAKASCKHHQILETQGRNNQREKEIKYRDKVLLLSDENS